MTRAIDPATEAAASAASVRVAQLVALDFASGWVRLWTGLGDLTWNGDVFTGAGQLLGISSIVEQAGVRANGITLTLSGIPSGATLADGRNLIDIVLGETWQGRQALVWQAVPDGEGGFVGAPLRVAKARMDALTQQEAETCTLRLTIEPRTIDQDRARIRRYTNADQQAQYPGDKGFANVDAIAAGIKVIWGRAA